MKKAKILALALTCVLAISAVALAGCGKSGSSSEATNTNSLPSDTIEFTNSTDARIGSIYVSRVNDTQWGDPTAQGIAAGDTIRLTFSVACPDGATTYDFGSVDSNDVNRDFYEVALADGDRINLSESTLIISHSDGTSDTYTCTPEGEDSSSSSSGGTTLSKTTPNSFIGTWEISGMTDTTEDEIEAMKTLGYVVECTFSEDGIFKMNLFGSVLEGTWESKDTSAVSVTIDAEPVDVTLNDDGEIVFDIDGDTLSFAKISDEVIEFTSDEETSTEEA